MTILYHISTKSTSSCSSSAAMYYVMYSIVAIAAMTLLHYIYVLKPLHSNNRLSGYITNRYEIELASIIFKIIQ